MKSSKYSRLIIRHLEPHTLYEVRVTPIAGEIVGQPSEILRESTCTSEYKYSLCKNKHLFYN